MAKKTKAKSSPVKKKQNESPPSERQWKFPSFNKRKGRGGFVWPLMTALVVVIAILLYPHEEENHTPPLGYIEMQHHEQVPVRPELLSHHPKVFVLRNVLSPDECDEIITLAKQAHRVASTTGTMSNKTAKNEKEHEWRRSTTAWLRKDDGHASPAIKTMLSRIAAAANVTTASLQRGNPLHVTEYDPDGFYMPHTDSLHVEDLQKYAQRREYKDLDGFAVEGGYPHSARFFTGLCYLTDDFEGGETIFPLYDNDEAVENSKKRITAMQNANSQQTMNNWKGLLPAICNGTSVDGMSIAPKRGNCVLFYNHFIDENGLVGQLDRQSLHAGCDVRGGQTTKWIANVWAETIPTDAVRQEAARLASESATS